MPAIDCAHFQANRCGSCTLLNIAYPQQVEQKSELCRELLEPFLGGSASTVWLPPALSKTTGFRNRAKFVVAGSRKQVTLGIVNSSGLAVDLTDCPIQSDTINNAGIKLRDFLNKTGLAPYSVAKKQGELKFVHVTEATTGKLLVRFVVRSAKAGQQLAAQTRLLQRDVPQIETCTVNILPEHKAVLEGETEYVLWGFGLTMPLARVTLNLLPQSFFQTNTVIAQQLYQQVADWVAERSPASVWDLYCGVGGFALHCAAPGRRVLGVELSEAAIYAAKKSARAAKARVGFVAADATAFALNAPVAEHPELLIVNPPRRGIGEELCDWIAGSNIQQLVYSSCNPKSLATDLARMGCFRVVRARLFDMFAHTKHVECAVLLERVG